MELKSPNKNIRIVGYAGVIAGVAILASNLEGFAYTFGIGILSGGLMLVVLPFFRTHGRK